MSQASGGGDDRRSEPDARAVSAAKFTQINEALNASKPPEFEREALDHVCTHILRDNDRLIIIRALMAAILGKDNDYRITAEQFAQLFLCEGWLAYAGKPVTTQTIRNFIEKVDSKPKSPRILASYLYGLLTLGRGEHPCFNHPVPAVLMRMAEPLITFERAIGIKSDGKAKFSADDVIRKGRALYHIMERGGTGIQAGAFNALLQSRLFGGMRPITNDIQLDSSTHFEGYYCDTTWLKWHKICGQQGISRTLSA